MTEIIFLIEKAAEGGYTARAFRESIFTQGETLEETKRNIKDAVDCHFEENTRPTYIVFQ